MELSAYSLDNRCQKSSHDSPTLSVCLFTHTHTQWLCLPDWEAWGHPASEFPRHLKSFIMSSFLLLLLLLNHPDFSVGYLKAKITFSPASLFFFLSASLKLSSDSTWGCEIGFAISLDCLLFYSFEWHQSAQLLPHFCIWLIKYLIKSTFYLTWTP